MHENGEKQQNDKLCHETQNAFITSTFGSGRQAKIEGVGQLF